MPPPLALALCTGFVLFLLWLERGESNEVSAAAWIPTIWFMSVSSKSLGMWFGTTGSNEAGSPLDRMFLVALTLAALAVLVRRRFKWAAALRSQWLLVVLLGYMLVSAAWSDIAGISVRRWSREVIIVVMALALLSERHPRETVESLLRRSAYILMPFSLLLIKYYPSLGVIYAPWSGMQMWAGVSAHKNGLSAVCVVSAFFLLWAVFRRWRLGSSPRMGMPGWADVVVLLLSLYLLRGDEGAYSAASLATMAIGVLALVGLLSLRRTREAPPGVLVVSAVMVLLALGASAPFVGGSNTAVVSSALGRDATLTGRTDTWAELLPVVKDSPLLGSGFGSFWTTDRRDYYEMSHGHNGYLDVLLELGFVGLSLWVAWLLSCARILIRTFREHYEWACLGIGFLLMAAAHNTAESDFSTLAGGLTAAVLFVSWTSPRVERVSSRPNRTRRASIRRPATS